MTGKQVPVGNHPDHNEHAMLKPTSDCPLTPCIKLLSGAWTLEILYFLRAGPIHFGDLRRQLGKVSSKVLTTRLRALEKRGAIQRKVIPTYPPMVEYRLSRMGEELFPVLDAISEVSQTLREKYGSL
jgi:DNA-binding HxlR family transcriptional regulator